ncbi:polyhydroxyalkanoate synthesis repressor PhaR [Pontixanthobacter gangjinensis]|uniref:Polyhydroxyalkanoate synthesis repressor PhaR n=1 Tax=Pontixanthobacter gangjinensis TaxID=1028742 RepID=A0A6I4SQ72_9SPHN|nr:polyhydroxyalkanoate synthesis repressor PhaR [Pontixanthobacter gangjinensis]MXO56997.1 polyhydroxyalkanoate synthesis repressor PhaR [Pontixanthobacter gangjinensis]
MAKRNAQPGDKVTIKKYANRRLYNTGSSSYITLDDLAKMTRENVEFEVVDAKSGEDITHSILTQIIMDEEASGKQMLPVSFLRDLIAMYGNSMQSMMPQYLEASMANFRANQAKIQEALKEGLTTNPIAKIAETNLAVMRAVGQVILPGNKEASKPEEPDQKSEIDELRRQMAEMQKRLDEIGR